MPAGNGTGPFGQGSMSGRGMGFCTGYGMPGFQNRSFGAGCGPGRGRGFRRMFFATGLPGWMRFGAGREDTPGGSRDNEKAVLTAQAIHFTRALEAVRKRLGEIEPAGGE